SISVIHCQPPHPSFFPYTPLFRSDPRGHALRDRPHHRILCDRTRDALARPGGAPPPAPAGVAAPPAGPALTIAAHRRRQLPLALDRKSTRLNSSHVSISYAVFCLK